MHRSPRLLAVGLAVVLVHVSGCRALLGTAAPPLQESDDQEGDDDDGEGEGEGGAGTGTGSGSGSGTGSGKGSGKKKGKSVGPKIMGFEYFARYTYGMIRGTYSDEQQNKSIDRGKTLENVKLKGSRYQIESYPTLFQTSGGTHRALLLFELRREKPEPVFWASRTTGIFALGYVLPFARILAPIVGINAEFNAIDLDHPAGPEVAKSDVRAHILGARARQKIWGTGKWLAFSYDFNLHMLNFTLPNNGYEAEAGLSAALKWRFLRVDLGASYLYQRYSAHREAGLGFREQITVDSTYKAMIFAGTIWL